jgi:Protein of unknown function (DUF429)
MGIDLSSQPRKTGVCLLRWDAGPPELLMLCRGKVDDGSDFHTKWLSTTAYGIQGDYGAEITKVGIDAPFGWPIPFLDAVSAYRESVARWPTGLDEPLDECRLRETDRAVHRRAAKWPLSVTSDKIALPAMRCASLLTDIAAKRGEEALSREGSGLCCEVYPDPALRRWTAGSPRQLSPRESYKGKEKAAKRMELLQALVERLPIEDGNGLLDRAGLEDDYLDALICALVARAVELEQTYPPESDAERECAEIEGWIHLPSAPLEALAA